MDGKAKCKQLKSIRRTIADKLNIDLHQTECTYQGKCTGTCPLCKQEEEIINKELGKRAKLVVAGTTAALMLAGCAPLDEAIYNITGHRVNSGNTPIIDYERTAGVATPMEVEEADRIEKQLKDEEEAKEICIKENEEECTEDKKDLVEADNIEDEELIELRPLAGDMAYAE